MKSIKDVREIQIKNEIARHTFQDGYYKNMKRYKCWPGCGEKRTVMRWWWDYKLVRPLWQTVWVLLQILKIELSHDTTICFWVYIQRK